MFEDKEDDIESILTLYIKDDGSTHIDINLSNYEDATMINFAKLISNLSLPQLQLEAITMTKDGLMEQGNENACEIFLIEVAKNAVKNKINDLKQKEDNEPCIKPSDMF